MSTSIENNLFNNSISAINEVDQTDHSINTYSDANNLNPNTCNNNNNNNMNNINEQQDNTLEDASHSNLNDDSQANENSEPFAAESNTTYDTYNNTQETSTNKNTAEESDEQRNEMNESQNSDTLEPEQFRKVFVGGLSQKTDADVLKDYFAKYGELVDFVVMKDNKTGKPKGFGFITYARAQMVDDMMRARPHVIDGKTVEPKRATPREDSGKKEVQATVKKLFVGNLRETIGEADLRDYFAQYGNVIDITIMKDKETSKYRGFGFVSFDDYDPVDKIILERNHQIQGINLHCQKALPKEMKEQHQQQQQHHHHQFQMGRGGSMNFMNNQNNGLINGFPPMSTTGMFSTPANFGNNKNFSAPSGFNFSQNQMYAVPNAGFSASNNTMNGNGYYNHNNNNNNHHHHHNNNNHHQQNQSASSNRNGGGRGGAPGPMRNNAMNKNNRAGPYQHNNNYNNQNRTAGFQQHHRGGSRGGFRNNNNNQNSNNMNGQNSQ